MGQISMMREIPLLNTKPCLRVPEWGNNGRLNVLCAVFHAAWYKATNRTRITHPGQYRIIERLTKCAQVEYPTRCPNWKRAQLLQAGVSEVIFKQAGVVPTPMMGPNEHSFDWQNSDRYLCGVRWCLMEASFDTFHAWGRASWEVTWYSF